ncbi:MAG: hypothetical protein AAGH76_09075 [Pseudomonadota bacterium]
MVWLNGRRVLLALGLSLVAIMSFAQSDADDDEAATETPIEIDEEPTESGSYEDDKDFIPSKDVSADQPLTYPDDI